MGCSGGSIASVHVLTYKFISLFTPLTTVVCMSVVISVRVPREVKEILEEGEVDISKEVRSFLEELAWRVKTRKFVEKWSGLLKDVKPSEEGFAVRSVREDRESH